MVDDKTESGKLYLVATPIGNLKDMTYRAVEILKEADYIAAEDTRKSRVLLSHYGISGKVISYYGAREEVKAEKLLKLLSAGRSVALITDAGTPAVSDPAVKVVRLAISHSIDVVPIPGPSALLASLCASGLDTSSFLFEGFLPVKGGRRLKKLKEICEAGKTAVLFESTHRIVRLLGELEAEIPGRKIVIARELTKLFEEFLRGTPAELKEKLTGKRTKGEFVVLIPAADAYPV
jgi:16S rRNA (cytidine1402-2'-O)-methyltransferase